VLSDAEREQYFTFYILPYLLPYFVTEFSILMVKLDPQKHRDKRATVLFFKFWFLHFTFERLLFGHPGNTGIYNINSYLVVTLFSPRFDDQGPINKETNVEIIQKLLKCKNCSCHGGKIVVVFSSF
jgi:hypothetical protein